MAKSTDMCVAAYLNQSSGIFGQRLQRFPSSDSWPFTSLQPWQQTQEQLAISMSSGQNAKTLAKHQAPAQVASALCMQLKTRHANSSCGGNVFVRAWQAALQSVAAVSQAAACNYSLNSTAAQIVHTCTVTHLAAGPAVPILSTGHSMPVEASQTCIWPFSCAVRSCQSLRRREGAASMLPVSGDCDPTDERLLISRLSIPCIDLCCLAMATGPRTCTMGLSAFMALAAPVNRHTAESVLPSLHNVKHVLGQHGRNTLVGEVLPLLLEANFALSSATLRVHHVNACQARRARHARAAALMRLY